MWLLLFIVVIVIMVVVTVRGSWWGYCCSLRSCSGGSASSDRDNTVYCGNFGDDHGGANFGAVLVGLLMFVVGNGGGVSFGG